MQDIFESVRRSRVFRTAPPDNEESPPSPSPSTSPLASSTLVDKFNSCIGKSRVFSKSSLPLPPIRWRKGELIGCGAFGHVYMGMNLDSGELLAVKQVLIAAKSASKDKAQAHIRELEEEVKLLKNLSHPNIVRYLGTVREEETLNILLEFVPGGSISSLLGKFGSFPEAVIRTYTKQLLLGLEYLHKNGIMHRDIKGANILVDNKGCIKLADFGASKQVVELATVSGAKSMKGTPYWMAPEVILQTGHSLGFQFPEVGSENFFIAKTTRAPGVYGIHDYTPFTLLDQKARKDLGKRGCVLRQTISTPLIGPTQFGCSADIWSVGCTVIEMATGKPPWSQQYQEVAALFYIGKTKSHPPIPEHLSVEAKDFLLKCLQQEPNLRPSASELLQHPFVTGDQVKSHPLHTSVMENSETPSLSSIAILETSKMSACPDSTHICNLDILRCTAEYPVKSPENKHIWGRNNSDDDMCRIDKDEFTMGEIKSSSLIPENLKSFNPISEPSNDRGSKMDGRPELEQRGTNLDTDEQISEPAGCSGVSGEGDKDFSFSHGQSLSVDDDELTESKIQAFLDEKALELKKLQTPLYEEFNNSLLTCSPSFVKSTCDEATPKYLKLPPKSRSPSQGSTGVPSPAVDALNTGSPGSNSRCVSNNINASDHSSQDILSSPLNDWKKRLVDDHQEPISPSMSFSERQRKWKEELDQELARKREMMRQAGVGGKTSSPKDRALNRQRERTRFASPDR